MAAGKQLHGNLTPAHADGCAAQCFEGVQRGSLIVLSVHPRPQAATLALRSGVVRSIVWGPRKVARLCGERRSSVMIELSRLRGSERYAACSDDVMAHRPYGSAQTGMYPFALYCGVGLPTGFLCQGAASFTKERNRERVSCFRFQTGLVSSR